MSEEFVAVETATGAPPVAIGTTEDGAEDDVARLVAVLGQAAQLAGVDLQHRQAIVDLLRAAGDIARAGERGHDRPQPDRQSDVADLHTHLRHVVQGILEVGVLVGRSKLLERRHEAL